MDNDRGYIVVRWLIRIVVVIALLGVVVYEGASVGFARVNADEAGRKALEDAGFRFRDTNNIRIAEDAARSHVEQKGAELVSYSADARAGTSSITVRKRASTLFIHKIGPLRKYTVQEVTKTSTLPH